LSRGATVTRRVFGEVWNSTRGFSFAAAKQVLAPPCSLWLLLMGLARPGQGYGIWEREREEASPCTFKSWPVELRPAPMGAALWPLALWPLWAGHLMQAAPLPLRYQDSQ
jgi:hypothetical protein